MMVWVTPSLPPRLKDLLLFIKFTHQIFTEHLLCAQHRAKCWGNSSEWSRNRLQPKRTFTLPNSHNAL